MAVLCIAFQPAAIEHSRQQGTHRWLQQLLVPQGPCSDQHTRATASEITLTSRVPTPPLIPKHN